MKSRKDDAAAATLLGVSGVVLCAMLAISAADFAAGDVDDAKRLTPAGVPFDMHGREPASAFCGAAPRIVDAAVHHDVAAYGARHEPEAGPCACRPQAGGFCVDGVVHVERLADDMRLGHVFGGERRLFAEAAIVPQRMASRKTATGAAAEDL